MVWETPKNYYIDDEKITLDALCRKHPQWAANRIRASYRAFNAIMDLLRSGDANSDRKIAEICEEHVPEFERH